MSRQTAAAANDMQMLLCIVWLKKTTMQFSKLCNHSEPNIGYNAKELELENKYIFISWKFAVFTLNISLELADSRKNRIHDTGDAPLTVIKSRPLLDKWLWPALYGSDQSKICLIERWIGLICRIKRAWPIRLVHRLTGCKPSTDRLFHRFVYGIIEATQHG